MRVAGRMSEQSCTASIVEQGNMQDENDLEPTHSSEAVLRKAEVSRSNVSQALVNDGWCWWYQKYGPEN